MSDETRVREVLGRLADDAGASRSDALWTETQQQIHRRRRNRIVQRGLATSLAVAIVIGGVALAVGRDRDRHGAVAVEPTPGGAPPADALAVADGKLVVLDARTGSVVRALPGADALHRVVEVTTSVGAPRILYTRTYPPDGACSEGPKLLRAGPDGSDMQLVVGGTMSHPLLSPDGREVAYTMSECGSVGDVGLTDLYPDAPFPGNYRWPMLSVKVEERPLAWTPDSTKVFIATADNHYRIVTMPDGQHPQSVTLPARVHAAAFTSSRDVVVAYRPASATGDTIATYDAGGGTGRTLFTLAGQSVSSMSIDAASGALLIVAVDAHGNGELMTRSGTTLTRSARVPGLTTAAWYQPAAAPAPSTSISSTSTPATTTTTVAGHAVDVLPPAVGFAGITEWQTRNLSEFDAAFLADAASPQQKADALANMFRSQNVEGRRDVSAIATDLGPRRAQVEARVIGMANDSVGGVDYRLQLVQSGDGAPWTVSAVEERDLCLRGLDGNLCV